MCVWSHTQHTTKHDQTPQSAKLRSSTERRRRWPRSDPHPQPRPARSQRKRKPRRLTPLHNAHSEPAASTVTSQPAACSSRLESSASTSSASACSASAASKSSDSAAASILASSSAFLVRVSATRARRDATSSSDGWDSPPSSPGANSSGAASTPISAASDTSTSGTSARCADSSACTSPELAPASSWALVEVASLPSASTSSAEA
mmetsp:Transcript_19577/g.69306  ORF Transcript_19577/g.69306 Transcript_19577/m.69306 type:complete len:206 (+) Transcript_19577:3177-3794(+)